MAKKLIQRITKSSFPQWVERYIDTKRISDDSASRLKAQRDDIINYVAANGIEDDKGHMLIHIPGVALVKRERRASRVLDADFAEEWLKKRKLWLKASTTITVLDEDALLAMIYDETVPPDIADKMYSEKESFALKVTPE